MSWQAFFEKDRNILILCICLSAVIWVFNRMSQGTRSTIDVHVETEVPDQFVLSDLPDQQIRVGVEGTGWQLLKLFRQDPLRLTLKPGKSTEQQAWSSDQLRLRMSDLSAFTEVQIVSVNPARISLSLDSAAQKTIPIELPYRIEYAKGYSNTRPIEISPKKIQVSGPKNKVGNLQKWTLDSLVLKDVRKSLIDSIDLTHAETYEEVYKLSPDHITYDLPVSEFTELKKICLIEAPADSISLFPRRTVVRMRVPIDKYNEAQDYTIDLGIDLESGSDGSNVPIRIQKPLPYWMKSIRISPSTVDYLIPDSLSAQ